MINMTNKEIFEAIEGYVSMDDVSEYVYIVGNDTIFSDFAKVLGHYLRGLWSEIDVIDFLRFAGSDTRYFDRANYAARREHSRMTDRLAQSFRGC